MFSTSIPIKSASCLGLLFLAGCATFSGARDEPTTAAEFYTLTAEIALARGEPRVAALQYEAAAAEDPDPALLRRGTEVSAAGLQPDLAAKLAQRWITLEPSSVDAERAAARAALALYRIDDAAAHYKALFTRTPGGVDAALTEVERDLTGDDNIFGARALADRLAALFPGSTAAMRIQGLTALRADDPAAAVQALTRAVNHEAAAMPEDAAAASLRRELRLTLLRARILAGDVEEPLSQARAMIASEDNSANRFEYVVLLMTAQRNDAAAEQLQMLSKHAESKPAALRLLGLLEFQQGHFDAADAQFQQVLRTGQLSDDAFYYLAVIADRNGDSERALRLYSQVQHGDEVLPALLRAAAILYLHGAPAAAEDLLDQLAEDEPQRAPEIINTRARIYADAGESPRAEEALRKGLQEYPDSMELRYARASVSEDDGNFKQAVRELGSVLKDRPADPAAMNALGFTLADHSRNLSQARRLIERAHVAAPKNAAILDSMGWVLFRQGHDAEALPYLRAAYSDDRSGDIAAHLGEVLWHRGERDAAQHLWSQAGIIDADNKLLKSTRRRLQAGH